MITDLLTKDTIHFSKEVSNWEEGIKLAAKPLLENGSIEEGYVTACINSVKTLGAYIVLAPLLAMPHARAPEHVNKMSLSYLNLEKPVNVLNDPERPAKIFILLATKDNNEHLDILATLGNMLADDDKLDRLLYATRAEEVLETISE